MEYPHIDFDKKLSEEHKKPLTLAERFKITKHTKAAFNEMMTDEEAWRYGTLRAYLSDAEKAGFYAKRSGDRTCRQETEEPETADTKLSSRIESAENQLRYGLKPGNGDVNAERFLRTLKDNGKYGKRCNDINLEA